MKVSAIQMVSGKNVDENLSQAERLIKKSVDESAQLVVLPETFLTYSLSQLPDVDAQRNMIASIQEVAKFYNVWLVAGTLPLYEKVAEEGLIQSFILDKVEFSEDVQQTVSFPHDEKYYATCLCLNNEGDVHGVYRKIHLFDADVEDNTGAYRESDKYRSGETLGVVESPWGCLGIGVCYDLRFPEYFRRLVDCGVRVVFLPAAFTHVTGEAHWEVLLRARAIENQIYIVAANQGGMHTDGRETWGGTMIVDPWGRVLSSMDKGEGVVSAELCFESLNKVRKNMPVLKHRHFELSC